MNIYIQFITDHNQRHSFTSVFFLFNMIKSNHNPSGCLSCKQKTTFSTISYKVKHRTNKHAHAAEQIQVHQKQARQHQRLKETRKEQL